MLDLFDNTYSDDELCIKVDDKMAVPLQLKGTKCVFESRLPTCCELDFCPHYDIKNYAEWNPRAVDLQSLHKISQVKKESRIVYNVKSNTVQIF